MAKKGKIRSKDPDFKTRKTAKKLSNKNLKTWKPKSKVGRIVLKNLSYKTTTEDIQNLLVEFGDLREVKLLQRPDGSPVGCGFAQFTRKECATKAIEGCNNFDFMGRKIFVDWALPKTEYILKTFSSEATNRDENGGGMDALSSKSEAGEMEHDEESTHQHKKRMKKKTKSSDFTEEQVVQSTLQKSQHYRQQNALDETGKHTKKTKRVKQKRKLPDSENVASNLDNSNEVKVEPEDSEEPVKKKRKKETSQNKKSRLIVRNLPFKVTEDILRDHFSKYGEVTEINLLKKPDGKLVGCAFIQFERVQSAAKAILGSSGKPLIGRIIVIDWAVPQKKYVEATRNEQSPEIKIEETEEETEQDIKEEVMSQGTIKEESDSESGFESDKLDKTDESEDESESETASITVRESDELNSDHKPKRPRIISNDVSEGCTIFVKNVPFSATNEELKSCMEQFGYVVYALICIDSLTEHSKGTAFVKFQKKESAEECLKAGTELTLNDQTLDVFRALSRDEIQQKLSSKKNPEMKKDSRNLYLVKEGAVMAGTPAAVGVSVADMSRRLQLERWKSQILRNLNMFVSPTRLVVHNVPPSWTDNQLRNLFQKHAGKRAIITEARIMRDMRNINADGTGKSKEYGFVSFKSHEDALQVLRHINNNPSIFTPSKRPIVSFSIESRAILKARQQRLERSRTNNHHSRNHVRAEEEGESRYETQIRHRNRNSESKMGKKKENTVKMRDEKKVKLENNTSVGNVTETKEFVGVISKQGNVKLATKFALKKQAALHAKHIKQNRKKEKLKQSRARNHISQEPIKQPKQKQNTRRKHKEEDKTFNKLINSYKSKLNSVSDFKKWYE